MSAEGHKRRICAGSVSEVQNLQTAALPLTPSILHFMGDGFISVPAPVNLTIVFFNRMSLLFSTPERRQFSVVLADV